MKLLSYLALGLFSAGSLFAGGIGGPFNSYSPLQSGIDGYYQATARGTNLTGIISFTYADGVPTIDATGNSWVFFVDGQVIRGQTSATIDENKVAGVLDSTALGSGSGSSSSSISLPLILLNSGTSSSGQFSGSIDLKSVNARFSGKGEIVPSPASTNQLIIISQETISDGTNSYKGPISVTDVKFTNSAGTTEPTTFKFSGYRLTTATGGGGDSGTINTNSFGTAN